MHSLPLLHRLTGQKVILLAEGEAGEAKRRLLERAGAVVVGEDNPSARLAFIALDRAEAAAARLKARGLLVNVTDRPELCDFTVPSILERGPVLIAVGTGGASAGLAKALRMRLETLLPHSLGALAEALSAARGAIRKRWPDSGTRRNAIDDAMAIGGTLDPLMEFHHANLEWWLEQDQFGSQRFVQTTTTIHLASDDPDDLTLRQARQLAQADTVVHDPDVPAEMLALARADASRYQSGSIPDPLPGSFTVILRRG